MRKIERKNRKESMLKKTHKTPTVYVESFELCKHIASCGIQVENGNTIISPGGAPITIFAAGSCDNAPESFGYCYTNGAGDKALFNS